MLVQHECTNAALYLKAVNVNLFPSSQVCLRFPSTLVHTASYFQFQYYQPWSDSSKKNLSASYNGKQDKSAMPTFY